MRTLLPAFLLLLALVPPPAAATSHLLLDVDIPDALDDARATPDVRLPQTDISRFTMEVVDGQVVQTVHVVGPWPDNNFLVEIRNGFGVESYTVKVERMNSSGSNARPTDYNTSFYQTAPLQPSKSVNFTFAREGNTATFRWPVSAIPSDAKCIAPRVTTRSQTSVGGSIRQVDDELDVRPTACTSQGARADGIDGTCPAATSKVVAPIKLDDPRDDVGERQNIVYVPHDNATIDILSLDTRLDGGWVVQTILLAEDSPRDQIDITIENRYRGNKSDFEPGAQLAISLLETEATGAIIGEGKLGAFHVRAARAEPVGWEFRWCASILPADATCFAPLARASLDNGDLRDVVRPAKELCPPLDEDAASDDGSPATPSDTTGAGGDAASGEEGSAESPGVGALALLVIVGALALALRRRA